MKINRFFALFLAVIMLLSIFAGCDADKPGTTNPSIPFETDPTGEATVPPTEATAPSQQPTTPETKPIDPTNCTHTMSEWKISDATCTKAGSRTRSCTSCGTAETETIEAKGHSYGAWSTTKKATCDTDGVKTRKCSTCGETQQETIASVGHAWDEGKVTVTPTVCSEMGIKTYTCKTCAKTKTEQIKGKHTFGKWKYEEYTYQQQDPTFGTWHDRISHRKVRICEKCGYKEYGNTPDHSCKQGSKNHTITIVKEGTCTVPERKRSTCNICGWYVEYDGAKSLHTTTEKKVHLADYGDYTNELDATIRTCSECDYSFVDYHEGKGYRADKKYYTAVNTSQGQAYANIYPNDGNTNLLEHPEWQTIKRDFKYDKAGYVKQYTLYWWYSGQQFSQVIKCGKGEIEAWFAEYGLVATHPNSHYSMKICGAFVQPYSIGYSG